MSTNRKAPRPTQRAAEIDPGWHERYGRQVVSCLRDVFGLTQIEAQNAVDHFWKKIADLSDDAQLLIYRDSPLHTASILAGASDRQLNEQEVLAYDVLCKSERRNADTPSMYQVLQVFGPGMRTE
jgi:hypothetical protein